MTRGAPGTTNVWVHPTASNFVLMEVFQNPVAVVIYVLGCFSLFWHLLHGFKSAFQSLGLNHKRYNPIIAAVGTAFSIIVPLVFALMPVSMFLDWIK